LLPPHFVRGIGRAAKYAKSPQRNDMEICVIASERSLRAKQSSTSKVNTHLHPNATQSFV